MQKKTRFFLIFNSNPTSPIWGQASEPAGYYRPSQVDPHGPKPRVRAQFLSANLQYNMKIFCKIKLFFLNLQCQL